MAANTPQAPARSAVLTLSCARRTKGDTAAILFPTHVLKGTIAMQRIRFFFIILCCALLSESALIKQTTGPKCRVHIIDTAAVYNDSIPTISITINGKKHKLQKKTITYLILNEDSINFATRTKFQQYAQPNIPRNTKTVIGTSVLMGGILLTMGGGFWYYNVKDDDSFITGPFLQLVSIGVCMYGMSASVVGITFIAKGTKEYNLKNRHTAEPHIGARYTLSF